MIAGLAAAALAGSIAGLDHVPIAVRDLEAAARTYQRLGFVLKPGRPHANGIRNLHAKFSDGTELELITASKATDDLTRTYVRHLRHGDGPAFLAFFVPEGPPPADAPGYVFFGRRNDSPTDRPEHFAHPNTARSLVSVWLAGELAAERRLLAAGGATFVDREVRVPDAARATLARLPEGEVLLLPPSRSMIPGRPIVGVTVRVDDSAAARRVLTGNGVPTRGAGRGPSVFVPPEAAHGLWLELRE
jgi:catechol 2,3-dioxygenase-like lactoylglutathione lyase family enzyme